MSKSDKRKSFYLSSLPFFILAHATHHLLTAMPQPMLPFIQDEFRLNKAQLGGITAAFSVNPQALRYAADPKCLFTSNVNSAFVSAASLDFGVFVGSQQKP
jgi:hypothetical protein